MFKDRSCCAVPLLVGGSLVHPHNYCEGIVHLLYALGALFAHRDVVKDFGRCPALPERLLKREQSLLNLLSEPRSISAAEVTQTVR
ncbi:MAG: hypothetical protein ONB06_05640 [candidate division KSB1 bacterium]|nr:hypothetical protein [candidate division KSB1 bacterium]